MTVFQIIAVLFGLFMMYVTSIHAKKRTLTVMEGSFWLSTWLLFVVIAILPDILIGISNAMKFSRVFDLLVVVALMVISILVFFSYFQQKEIIKKLEQLVRTQAIIDVLKKPARKRRV